MSYQADPPPSDLLEPIPLGDGGGDGDGGDEDGAILPVENDLLPEVEYELDGWTAPQRKGLELLLTAEDIAHLWAEGNLVVAEPDEARVDEIVDRAEAGEVGDVLGAVAGAEAEGALDLPDAAAGGDDEAPYTLLSHLFASTDRLANHPEALVAAADVIDGIDELRQMVAPYGVEHVEWIHVRRIATTLSESIADEATDDTVRRDAAALRDVLRPFL